MGVHSLVYSTMTTSKWFMLFQVEEKEMVNRLLPNKMGIWYRKKQKRLQKKAEENAKKIEEWVRPLWCSIVNTHPVTNVLYSPLIP